MALPLLPQRKRPGERPGRFLRLELRNSTILRYCGVELLGLGGGGAVVLLSVAEFGFDVVAGDAGVAGCALLSPVVTGGAAGVAGVTDVMPGEASWADAVVSGAGFAESGYLSLFCFSICFWKSGLAAFTLSFMNTS